MGSGAAGNHRLAKGSAPVPSSSRLLRSQIRCFAPVLCSIASPLISRVRRGFDRRPWLAITQEF